jgi:hypothetical protein
MLARCSGLLSVERLVLRLGLRVDRAGRASRLTPSCLTMAWLTVVALIIAGMTVGCLTVAGSGLVKPHGRIVLS